MKLKVIASMLIFSIVTVFATATVDAFYISPATQSYPAGSSQTVTIYAQPNLSNARGVELAIEATNLTITNYTTTMSGSPLVINLCSGNSVAFTSSKICVALAKVTDINSGDAIGTVTFTMPQSGSGTLQMVATTDNATSQYSNESTQTAVAGTPTTIGTYSVGASGGNGGGGNTLPNTASGDISTAAIALLSASTLVVLGLVTYTIVNKKSLEL